MLQTLCAINPYQSSSKKHYGWVIVSCEDPKATFVQFFSKNVLPEFRQELDGQDYDIDGYNIGKSKESRDKVMP